MRKLSRSLGEGSGMAADDGSNKGLAFRKHQGGIGLSLREPVRTSFSLLMNQP